MDSLPVVILKPGEADRVIAGHPWIYHGSILRMTALQSKDSVATLKQSAIPSASDLGWGVIEPLDMAAMAANQRCRCVVQKIQFHERRPAGVHQNLLAGKG